ncbi:SNF7 family protein [Abeliophyllum distichum]|uniref:SNF7 family protein n=1 Tax=Abeliophyllum distichum TaxID=126358 RepID=A0ABD1TVF2_9LAMI
MSYAPTVAGLTLKKVSISFGRKKTSSQSLFVFVLLGRYNDGDHVSVDDDLGYLQPKFQINKRGDTVEEKISKPNAELAKYEEKIKRTRPGPGPAQEAVKAQAMRILKQKRMYEGQRGMLYNQMYNLDQVAFAAEGIKDVQQTTFSDCLRNYE